MLLLPRAHRNAYSLLDTLQRDYPSLSEAGARQLPLWRVYLRLAHRFTQQEPGLGGELEAEWARGGLSKVMPNG